jgi:hypothetical protein
MSRETFVLLVTETSQPKVCSDLLKTRNLDENQKEKQKAFFGICTARIVKCRQKTKISFWFLVFAHG